MTTLGRSRKPPHPNDPAPSDRKGPAAPPRATPDGGPPLTRLEAVAAVLVHQEPIQAVADLAGRSTQTIRSWVEQARRGRDGRGRPAVGAELAREHGMAYEPRNTRGIPAAPMAPPPAKPAPGDDAPAEDDEPPDVLAILESVMRNASALAQEAGRMGNHTAAQKYVRDVAGLAPVIARIKKSQKADEDVIKISRADVSAQAEAMRDRVRALLARPLLCAECGRKLSIAWGHGHDVLATEDD